MPVEIIMPTETQLDNILVRQKNHIINLCNEGKHDEALTVLVAVQELWTTCTYAYKWNELRERVANGSQWAIPQGWDHV